MTGAVFFAAPARAEDRLPTPLDGLAENTYRAFTGYNLIYYGAAVASTAALSATTADHSLRVAVQENLHAPAWGDAAYYGGYVLPVVVAPGIWITGLVAKDSRIAGAGSAAVQALAVTVVTTTILKVGTGRPFPSHGEARDAPDRLDHPGYSREWMPFRFDGHYAWPSGHTSAAVSIAAALTAYYRGSVVVPAVAYPVALGIGAGMIVGDHHWTSDVIAGALIGQAIGWTIGDAFHERAAGTAPGVGSLRLVPLLGEVQGCAVLVTM